MQQVPEHTLHVERVKAQGMFSLGVRSLRKNLAAVFHCLKRNYVKEGRLILQKHKERMRDNNQNLKKKIFTVKNIKHRSTGPVSLWTLHPQPKALSNLPCPALGVGPDLGWRLGRQPPKVPSSLNHSLSQPVAHKGVSTTHITLH